MDSITNLPHASIEAMMPLATTPAGWIMGYAITAGWWRHVNGESYTNSTMLYFTPQAEPDAESLEWTVRTEFVAKTPIGALVKITCSKPGTGLFKTGSASYWGFIHIVGNRIVGANSDFTASASLADSDSGLLSRALAAMSPDALEDLARKALARAEALRSVDKAEERAAIALNAMRSNLDLDANS